MGKTLRVAFGRLFEKQDQLFFQLLTASTTLSPDYVGGYCKPTKKEEDEHLRKELEHADVENSKKPIKQGFQASAKKK